MKRCWRVYSLGEYSAHEASFATTPIKASLSLVKRFHSWLKEYHTTAAEKTSIGRGVDVHKEKKKTEVWILGV